MDEKKCAYKLKDRILVSCGSKMKFVLIQEIRIIRAEGDYSVLDLLDNNTYRMFRSLKEWELKLPEEFFIRINKSNIVNIDHIDRIKLDQNQTARIYMINRDEPLRLSRFYLKKVRLPKCHRIKTQSIT